MKKLLYIAFILASTGLVAQNSKVVSAYNSMNDKEFDKAAELINAAAENEKTMADAKTWLYRGQIYQQIAQSDKDFSVDKKTAVGEAMKSFKKAKELDSKNRWENEISNGMKMTQMLAMNGGIAAYNDKDYAAARDLFLMGEKGAQDLGEFDTLAVYNSGLAAEQAGDNETAITQYQKAADSGYLGPKMYLYMANLYTKEEMPEKYLAIVQAGRKVYPEDADLIVYELNYYLKNNKYEEAENNLKLAIEKEPDNKQLHFSLGVVYDNLKEYDKAIASYEKAIAIDTAYFDPIFNLGALYFNKGVEMNNASNDIKDNKKYNAAREESKKVFQQARPYLEKAHRLDPKDLSAVTSLKQLYVLLGEYDKSKEMKAKEEALEGAE